MFSTFSMHHFLKNQQTIADQKIKEFKKKKPSSVVVSKREMQY